MTPKPDPDAAARRFDRSFHDVDPLTGRVFSGGHPDSVWLIAIIYGMLVTAATINALVAAFTASEEKPLDTNALIAFVAAAGLLVPAIVLLFRRSSVAVSWMAGIFLLVLVGAIFAGEQMRRSGQLGVTPMLGLLFALFAQGSAAWYVYRMKHDGLLPGKAKRSSPPEPEKLQKQRSPHPR